MFFRDSEVCLERCDSYGDFGYLTKKSNIFILREICKRTLCPSVVTLALLLFLQISENKEQLKGTERNLKELSLSK